MMITKFKKEYPLNVHTFAVKQHVRNHEDHCVNLTRCELIHPYIDAIYRKLPHVDITQLYRYPDIESAKENLSVMTRIQANNMILSGGSDSMSSIIMNALGRTTKSVILQTPNYFSWENNAILNELSVVNINFGIPKRHTFSLDAFIDKLRHTDQSLVVISNPNNPTGFAFTDDQIITLSSECEKQGHLLVIDECFAPFMPIDHHKLLGIKDHVIIVRSYSKGFGLAGVRIAITIACERLIEYLSKWRPDSTVSQFALHYLQYMLKYHEELKKIVNSIVETRDKFITIIKKIKPRWKALPSKANFVTFYLENDNPDTIVKNLKQKGFVVRNLAFLSGLAQCIRIGVAHKGIMDALVNAISEISKEER